jgi:osmoprotectant transport system ATP-binding protein
LTDRPNLVALDHISHSFGDQKVLDDITIGLKEARITAILGKSGSGKSTLLQMINGMIYPDQGQVTLAGKPLDYKNIYSQRLQIGYVVQQVGLFPHMSVGDNIRLLAKISHKPAPEIEERVRVLMDMVQLPLSDLHKYPYQLSGGEQQRAGLCRAMLLQPPLLLMDEPFASLDYATKQVIYDHLLAIQQKESRTIALVTHDWEEAIKLADDFVWVAKGRVQEAGDKAKLVAMKNTYLAAL